jgi:hypothetical protein
LGLSVAQDFTFARTAIAFFRSSAKRHPTL